MNPRDAMDRFNEKWQEDPITSCYVWTASKNRDGYGQFWFRGRKIGAHQFAYLVVFGLVTQGMELDHLCRNTSCVNVHHLEAVTHKINCLRGEAPPAQFARRVSCPRGHTYSGDNLSVRKDGGRRCRTCKNERERRRYAVKRVSVVGS